MIRSSLSTYTQYRADQLTRIVLCDKMRKSNTETKQNRKQVGYIYGCLIGRVMTVHEKLLFHPISSSEKDVLANLARCWFRFYPESLAF